MNPLNRRKLLTSGVAIAVASTLRQSEAQGTQTKAAGPFTVGAGEARPGKQWLVHGEKAFSTKVSGADVAKSFAVLEIHTPPGLGPELHIHPSQNECIFMLSGSIGLECGPDRRILRAGDVFMAPLNVPHAYVTLGNEPAHMLHLFDPAGDTEGFFAEYAPLVNVEGEPDHKKLAQAYVNHGLKVVGPPLQASSFSA